MNATPSIAGLLKFIASQPSARPVDHSSYATCAVGTYAREVLGHEIPVASVGHATREQIDAVRADPVFIALWKEAGTERWHVASANGWQHTQSASVMDILNRPRGLPTTYGELVRHIYNQRFAQLN